MMNSRKFLLILLIFATVGCGGGGSIQDEMRQRAEALAKIRRAEREAEEAKEKAEKAEPATETVAKSEKDQVKQETKFEEATTAASSPTDTASTEPKNQKSDVISVDMPTYENRRPSTPLDAQARREMAMKSLRAIGRLNKKLSDENYWPFRDVCNAGEPLLSWRVKYLKELGYQDLFDQFHLDEPWDSRHNKQLLKFIPDEYLSPERFDEKTNFLAFRGSEYGCRGCGKVLEEDHHDSLTVVEVNDELAVPWTKPTDYMTTASTINSGIGKLRGDGAFAITLKGVLFLVKEDVSAAKLHEFANAKKFKRQGVKLPYPPVQAPSNAPTVGSGMLASNESPASGASADDIASMPDFDIPPIPGISGASLDMPSDFGRPPVSSPPSVRPTSFSSASSNAIRGTTKIPDNQAIREASGKLRELFLDQLERVNSPDEKLAVARRMFERSSSLSGDSAGLFALLTAVRNMAIANGEFRLCQEAGELLKQTFDVEGYKVDLQTVSQFGRGISGLDQDIVQPDQFGKVATQVIRHAVSKDEYVAAVYCANYMDKMIKLGDNSVTAEVALALKQHVTIAHNRYKTVVPAIETLAVKPDDPSASMHTGIYLCFVKGSWAEGLKSLRKSGDTLLSAIATAEENAASLDASGMVALGDKWWKVATKTTDSLIADKSKGRAIFWYKQALPQLGETLDRLRATSRIQDSSETVTSSVLEDIVNVIEGRKQFGQTRNSVNGTRAPKKSGPRLRPGNEDD